MTEIDVVVDQYLGEVKGFSFRKNYQLTKDLHGKYVTRKGVIPKGTIVKVSGDDDYDRYSEISISIVKVVGKSVFGVGDGATVKIGPTDLKEM